MQLTTVTKTQIYKPPSQIHFFTEGVRVQNMADQSRQTSQKLYESAQVSYRATKFLIVVTIGAALLVLSGLTLTGTVMALIMATPVLVLFSPVLVPAGIVLFLTASGFVLSGLCGMVAVAAFWWLYTYTSNHVAAKQRAHGYGQFTMLGVW